MIKSLTCALADMLVALSGSRKLGRPWRKNIDKEKLMRSYNELCENYQKCNAWGLSMTCDLKNCSEILVKSRSAIKSFVDQLVQKIEMKKYGDLQVVYFGEKSEVAGFSFFQLIETSNISGHLVDKTKNVYLDICSCKVFDPWVVEEFSRNYWEANETQMSIHFRET